MIGSVRDLIKFAAERGVTISEDEAPVLIAKANDYLETLNWLGSPVNPEQEFPWPRTGVDFNGSILQDEFGNAIEISPGVPFIASLIPRNVYRAIYRLCIEQKNGVDIQPTVAGKQIIEERIEGALTFKYDSASIGNPPVFPWIDALLGRWIKGSVNGGTRFQVRRG